MSYVFGDEIRKYVDSVEDFKMAAFAENTLLQNLFAGFAFARSRSFLTNVKPDF